MGEESEEAGGRMGEETAVTSEGLSLRNPKFLR